MAHHVSMLRQQGRRHKRQTRVQKLGALWTRRECYSNTGVKGGLRVAPDRQAIATLSRLMEDPNPGLRIAIMAALKDPDPCVPEAVSLLRRGLRDSHPLVRLAAVRVLIWLGPAAAPAGPELMRLLDDEDKAVGFSAAISLAAFSCADRVIAFLLYGMLENVFRPAELYERVWLNALRAVGPARVTNFLAGQELFLRARLLVRLEQTRNGRRLGVALCEYLSDDQSLIRWLRERLDHEDLQVAQASAAILVRLAPLADDRLPGLLFGALEEEISPTYWCELLAGLGPLVTPYLPRLLRMIDHGFSHICILTVIQNCSSSEAEQVDLLLRLSLRARDPLADHAGNRLASMGNSLLPKLKPYLSHQHKRLRNQAARVIAKFDQAPLHSAVQGDTNWEEPAIP